MAEAILGLLLENLQSLIQRDFGQVWGVQTEIKKLESTLLTIQAVLEDAEMKQIRSEAVRDWLSKLKDAAYDADDILNEWSIGHDEFLRQPESDVSSKTCTNQVRDALLSCLDFKRVVFHRKIAKKINEIKERFDEIAKEKSEFHLKEWSVEGVATTHSSQNRETSSETSSVPMETQIYGRDKDRENIVNLLLENENDVSVYPILGIGGLGKTTLAQFVYNDERVVKHFDQRIFVCVSDDIDVKRLTKAIVEYSSGNPCGLDNLDAIQNQLKEILTGKKFLLVLDDVWNERQDEWHVLRNSLTCGAKGSSIIVTTRLQTVATITGTSSAYELDFLSKDDCWSLFKYYAFGTEEEKPNLVSIGQAIVEKCGGVPLAAKALGSLLRFKRDEEQWKFIRDSEIWGLEEGQEATSMPAQAALRLSYKDLSPKLRQCFAYCSLFPKDYEMSKEMLIHLWMANGFLQSVERIEPEDVGEAIFSELLWRSFFQDMKEDDHGNIETFKMHNQLHDLVSSIMKDESLKLEVGKPVSNIPEKARHLSITCLSFFPSSGIIGRHLSSHPSLQTLLFLGLPSYLSIVEDCVEQVSVISRLIHLRVLDLRCVNVRTLLLGNLKQLRYLNLHCCHIVSLPKSYRNLRNLQILDLSDNELIILPSWIGDFKHLRHLNLSHNKEMTSLPESICSLKKLHTLKLANCLQLKVLPENTRNMCNLVHLDNKACARLVHMPIGIGHLTCLQKLSCFIVSPVCGSDGGIKELQGLNLLSGELEIEGLQHLRNLTDAEEANLMGKQNLSELRLTWSEDVDNNSKAVLEGLQPSPNIKRLHITGYPGSTFPTWMQLGDTPLLFPRLIEISLTDLNNIEEWSLNWKENENLATLQSLSISYCKQLKALPKQLGSFSAMRSLKIHYCQELCSLPQELKSLTSLESVDICGCYHITSLPEMAIQGQKSSLKHLSIRSCHRLTSLSEGLRYLTSLEELSIAACPRLEFSEQDFEHLIALRRLEIDDLPQLVSFPMRMQDITTLVDLSISNCNRFRWPNWMTSLNSLVVSYCQYLERLPECFQDMFVQVDDEYERRWIRKY